MNKTLAGRYEEFKELVNQIKRVDGGYEVPEKLYAQPVTMFCLLTIVMEDNAKKDRMLKRLHQQYTDPRWHYNRAEDVMRELIEKTLTETSPNREIEL